MKWIIVSIVLAVFIFFFWKGKNSDEASYTMYPSETKRLMFPNDVGSSLEHLLKVEFLQRVPRSRRFVVRNFPLVDSNHQMTDYLPCFIDIPSIVTTDPEEAFILALPYIQAYVDTTNNVPELRPYLNEFPTNLRIWDFVVGFAEDEKTKLPFYDPYIASVLLCARNLEISRFYKYKVFPDGRGVRDVYDNVLDPAKGVLPAIKQMEIPHLDKQTIPRAIPEAKRFQGSLTSSNNPEFIFCKKFAKDNNFIFIALENACNFESQYDSRIRIELAYASQKIRPSLKEAQALVEKTRKEHVAFYMQQKTIDRIVNEMRAKGQETMSLSIDAQTYIGFRLSFWDEYIDRVAAPAISEVRVYGSVARYYVADEVQRLCLVHEEKLAPIAVDVPVVPPPKNDWEEES